MPGSCLSPLSADGRVLTDVVAGRAAGLRRIADIHYGGRSAASAERPELMLSRRVRVSARAVRLDA